MKEELIDFLITLSNILYPGEYKDSYLRCLLNKHIENIIIDENKDVMYLDYNKTVMLNSNQIDNNMSLVKILKEILICEEDVYLNKSEVEIYIMKFVNEFNKLFEGLYSNEEFIKIVNGNLKTIIYDVFGDNRYIPDKKQMRINHKEFDYILLHEFIHVIRGDIEVKYHGIDEGFTELVSIIYDGKDNEINIDSPYGYLALCVRELNEICAGLLYSYLLREDYVILMNDTFGVENTKYIISKLDEYYSLYDLNISREDKDIIGRNIINDLENKIDELRMKKRM